MLEAFPAADSAKVVTEIYFISRSPYVQKSLGLSCDVIKDQFTFQASLEERPYTKRGLLSTIKRAF